MTATRETILTDSPAHEGRARHHCLTRKVVTAWAPFYVAVDFDHQADPVKVHISQPGKKMGTEFGDVIDAIGEAATKALHHQLNAATSPPIMALLYHDTGFEFIWEGREQDVQVQDMLRTIAGAIMGLISEARNSLPGWSAMQAPKQEVRVE